MNDDHDGTDAFDAFLALGEVEDALGAFLSAFTAACVAVNNWLAQAPTGQQTRWAREHLGMTPATTRAVLAYLDILTALPPGTSLVAPDRALTAALGAAARTLAKGSSAE